MVDSDYSALRGDYTDTTSEFGAQYNMYTSSYKRLKAHLFTREEDFIVKEIQGKTVLSISKPTNYRKIRKGKFAHFTLVKKGISTFDAAKQIAANFSINERDVGYCGLKDTFAITAQRISIPYCRSNLKTAYTFENFFLKDGKPSNFSLSKDMHSGNRFEVTIHFDKQFANGALMRLKKNLKIIFRNGLPNFYGAQRFGSRGLNHIIGKEILRRNFEKAAKIWLAESRYSCGFCKFVRANWSKWDKCASFISKRNDLKIEYQFLRKLSENSGNFIDAFGSIPLGSFFVRSYSSYLFNKALSIFLSTGKDVRKKKLPLIGYGTKTSELNRQYLRLMDRDSISLNMFNFEEDKRLISKGGLRAAFFYPKDLNIRRIDKRTLLLSFSVGNGSFATVLLKFILDFRSNPGLSKDR